MAIYQLTLLALLVSSSFQLADCANSPNIVLLFADDVSYQQLKHGQNIVVFLKSL